MGASARERAVEIDDVDAIGAGGDKLGDQRRGIVAVHGGALTVAFQQPDHAASEQIDSGVDVHDALTKLAKSRKPAAWLFSGWNWHAKRLSRRTAAVNGAS